jgi:antitoxin (DNA-binding transcriptional repressor) of toxin-antitoxin stability system
MSKEKTISATEFKAKCLRLLEELDSGGLVITKRGRALAKVLPLNVSTNEGLIGSMKGRIKVKGDLLSTGLNWDAESGYAHRRRAAQRRSKKA